MGKNKPAGNPLAGINYIILSRIKGKSLECKEGVSLEGRMRNSFLLWNKCRLLRRLQSLRKNDLLLIVSSLREALTSQSNVSLITLAECITDRTSWGKYALFYLHLRFLSS
jgi:hypothetical protein